MTPTQCRAARALLHLSQQDLAELAGLGLSTVRDFETDRRQVSTSVLEGIRLALEHAGALFIPENRGGVGVRLKKSARRR